ncbi:MAG: hypothetical protein PHX78_09445 [bacterium]|nr:hypothetical protein [bacterium]
MNQEEKKKNRKLFILWLILFLIVFLAFKFHIDKKITASMVILYGLITPVFYGIISVLGVWLAAVPWIGPIIIKIISIPVFWILHGAAYLGSLIFVAKGESKKAIDARVITLVFLSGFLLGYIISKIF